MSGFLFRSQDWVSNKFEVMTQAKRSSTVCTATAKDYFILQEVLPCRIKLERVATKRSGIWMRTNDSRAEQLL